MRSSDDSVRLCRYHGTLVLLRSYGGPDIYMPESMWAAAQGRPDFSPPTGALASPTVRDRCAGKETTSGAVTGQ